MYRPINQWGFVGICTREDESTIREEEGQYHERKHTNGSSFNNEPLACGSIPSNSGGARAPTVRMLELHAILLPLWAGTQTADTLAARL